MKEQITLSKQSERGRSKWLRASGVNGTGCRASPAEGAQPLRRCSPNLKVRILENPGDFFEGAHPFPRCARKVSIFVERCSRGSSGPHPSASPEWYDRGKIGR